MLLWALFCVLPCKFPSLLFHYISVTFKCLIKTWYWTFWHFHNIHILYNVVCSLLFLFIGKGLIACISTCFPLLSWLLKIPLSAELSDPMLLLPSWRFAWRSVLTFLHEMSVELISIPFLGMRLLFIAFWMFILRLHGPGYVGAPLAKHWDHLICKDPISNSNFIFQFSCSFVIYKRLCLQRSFAK